MSGSAFRGTAADQDVRFKNKQDKLIKSMRFPAEFSQRVDMTKVNMDVMRPWIAERIYSVLGIEDEVIPEFVFGLLEQDQFPDPKVMQVNLTGFLETKTPKFMYELWRMLLSAQQGIGGIPAELLEAKRKELQQKQADRGRLQQNIQQRMADESPLVIPQPPQVAEITSRPRRRRSPSPPRDRQRSPSPPRGRQRSPSPPRDRQHSPVAQQQQYRKRSRSRERQIRSYSREDRRYSNPRSHNNRGLRGDRSRSSSHHGRRDYRRRTSSRSSSYSRGDRDAYRSTRRPHRSPSYERDRRVDHRHRRRDEERRRYDRQSRSKSTSTSSSYSRDRRSPRRRSNSSYRRRRRRNRSTSSEIRRRQRRSATPPSSEASGHSSGTIIARKDIRRRNHS